jgi:ATP-dependent 26S proteasome regulatory subunit
MDGFASGVEHLVAELHLLDLYLQRQVMCLRASHLLQEDEMRGLYIPDAQVDALLSNSPNGSMTCPEQETEAIRTLTRSIVAVRQQIDARIQASQDLPLVQMATLFGLTPFESQVVLLSVAPELMPRYETLFAYAQNDVTKKWPGVDLALTLFCQSFSDYVAHLGCFTPNAPLLRYRLLQLLDTTPDHTSTLPAHSLKVEPRIVDFLLAREIIDQRLNAFTQCLKPTIQLHDLILSDELCATLMQVTRLCTMGNSLVCLRGPAGVGKQAIVEAICAALNRSVLVVDARRMPRSDVGGLFTLLRREALLQGAALYLAHCERLLADEQGRDCFLAMLDALYPAPFPLFLGSEQAWHLPDEWPEACIMLDIPLPDFSQRLQHWRLALSKRACTALTDEDVTQLAHQFTLSGAQIRGAVQNAITRASLCSADVAIDRDDLYQAVLLQSRSSLSELAQKVELSYTWDDIVLPQRVLQQLREVCTTVIYRHVVFSQWGFERKLALGKGVNILFSGSSGTGKTMAASIIAQELKRDLYKIDLAQLVSKYIGETEKNLSRIFQEAQASNAVLFFDEADALFGKRSEVKDAHDRYANIEVAYLLQKMEEYTGIVILATNLSKNLDDAFARRMQHVIEFPFPDAASREGIWRKMLPPGAPLASSIDFGFLARQFELAGGNIRNITLASAFMAAEEGSSISMEHLVVAIARELRKMGKMPSQTNFQAYYELVRQKG